MILNIRFKSISIAGIIGVASLALTTGVGAQEDAGAEYESKANVTFERNEDVTNPVDPEDPDKELQPDDPNVDEGTTGPLSIDYVSNLDFGNVKISGNDKIYYANPVTFGVGIERAPYVQVTDNRGTKTGWELTVRQESQFTAEDGSSLEGARLSLTNGAVNSKSNTDHVTSEDVVIDNFTDSYKVLTAAEDNGAGTFTNMFGEIVDGKATSVSLEVPKDLKIKETEYTTKLTWTLTDTP